MGRLKNWPEKLSAHVEAWRDKQFEWGVHDCAMFCLRAEEAMCGESRFSDYIDQYESKQSARNILYLRARGGLEKNIDARLNERPVNFAGRGDLALLDTPDGDALGVFLGKEICAMGMDGLVFVSRSDAKKAWEV